MAKKTRKSKNAKPALTWFFPSTDHGEAHGFSDEQLQYFEGDHERYIARETIQNAVDARLDDTKPAVVIFEELKIRASDLPGNDMLSDKMKRCLKFAPNDEKAVPFFNNAINLLKSRDLTVLKISDFNTRGLTGSDEDIEGNWYRLVRAAGMSSMKGVGGGSFGIGKGAPIAASSLHTVFYSSINEKGEPVFQGKARLVSHIDRDNDIKQRTGFYGIDGYKAVRNQRNIPAFFRRSERGTDIFIMGYNATADWKEKLIKSVLQNFWLTIHHGDLEVLLKNGDTKVINKESLREDLETYAPEETKAYYASVVNSTQTFEQELKFLGKCILYVRKQDGYPRRIMMARKPKMFVTDKSNHVLREQYAGVFICEDDKGNRLLRSLEPPEHDKWDEKRAENGATVIRELEGFIRQSLKSMSAMFSIPPQDIPGLDRYLPDSDEKDSVDRQETESVEETDLSGEQETWRQIGATKEPEALETEKVVRKGIVTNKQSAKIIAGTTPGGFGNGGGMNSKPIGTEEGETAGSRIKTSNINFRSFVQKIKDDLEYHFAIAGREDCEGGIKIITIGDDSAYPAEILSARNLDSKEIYQSEGPLIGGLKIKRGETLRLAVKLGSKKKYALGIESYEN
ncbi:MAG: hypothetical protein HY569_02050 [Candidatus Magasanikbacteria bacterium]|nr:hypothetical protein [Candidatus Magasanikbacteria bacterium]